ncbi:hypothetical protein HG263_10545 [Pseudoalteromonas sp. JBTF-M23]|uniref:Uncharacterized protein n=1 Tax=Pseudoalteromonas caenipelagi TaxID=2726988 RepID=A0A849VDV3_9GAMM|nr:hypothetical protein [Pseudoalteromonas caenipelagi]NOU50970.1 hypothetical protein [Pseudoalteromonas caenipelagi]
MNKKNIMMLCTAASIFVAWLVIDNEQIEAGKQAQQRSEPLNIPDISQAHAVTTATKKELKTAQASIQIATQLSEAAQHVATQYEDTLKYPPYSQPLSVNDEDRLKPNYFYPVSSVIEGHEQPLSIKLTKYRHVYPEDIAVAVSGPELKQVDLKLLDVDTQQQLASIRLLQGPFEARFKGSKSLPRNVQIVAMAKLDNKDVPLVAQFQYMQPSAKVVSVEQVYARGDNMVIDVRLQVTNPGTYRLRANLFTDSNLPLAHLVSKQKLSKGLQTLTLRAHWSVLRPQVTQMRLAGFTLERMSPSPAEPSMYGTSEIQSYDIIDFSYDSLQQLPYQASAKEKQSLEFLRQLAKSGEL